MRALAQTNSLPFWNEGPGKAIFEFVSALTRDAWQTEDPMATVCSTFPGRSLRPGNFAHCLMMSSDGERTLAGYSQKIISSHIG